MFTLDAAIDTVQNGKKTFVNTFVQNESMKSAMVDFIETSQDTATKLASEMTKAIGEVAKFDYTKFGEGVMKAYNNLAKSATK